MGLCWSRECGSGPCVADHYVPSCAGWVGPTVLLCIFGFCSMMRPIEPFMTEFLTGPYKNLTIEQVTRQVYPVWTYSSLLLLVPVFLVTDFLRYKPVIILQGLTYVAAFLLILLGSGVHSAQLAFFCYSIATAANVAYSSYIYSMVQPGYYQRVTSYVKGGILLGNTVGSLLGQLLVSVGRVPLYGLTFLTVLSVSVALVTSFFLPVPKTSLFHGGTYSSTQGNSSEDTVDSESRGFYLCVKSMTAARHVGRMIRRLVSDCKECYSSVAVVFLCIWAAAGMCGFYQVTAYIQPFWLQVQPDNFTAYNGVVDAISTLAGTAATVAVGHMSVDWSVCGELVLGAFTMLIAGAIFLMDVMDNIWVSYTCYSVFKAVYLPLSTICTFQIAKLLSRRRYALVFGINTFMGTFLQCALTAIVINTKSLQLTITSQFFIYASYFAAISLLFTVRGVYTLLQMKCHSEREASPPEASHP